MDDSLLFQVAEILSALCGVLLFFLVLYFRLKKPRVVNVFSFKQNLWIGLIDTIEYTWYMVSRNGVLLEPYNGISDHWWIHFHLFLPWFLNAWLTMVVVCIALDLHLSFVFRFERMERIQRFYTPISILLALCYQLPSHLLLSVDYEGDKHRVFLGSKNNLRLYFVWFLQFSWEFICTLYTVVAVVSVLYSLWKKSHESGAGNNMRNEPRNSEHRLKRTILFALLYPVVLILSQWTYILPAFNLFLDILVLPKIPKLVFWILMMLQSLAGVFHLLVFFFHPTFRRALEDVSWWPIKKERRLATQHELPVTSNSETEKLIDE
ncbi:uncharacterized protein VTP21DRAFT_5287 [Calcarisporiella thermophila]|uniref:uncharacterized protein n=1 Tax=Calcarisporiella thermophila TaxID=911321 RepID=UPI003743DB12